jgi:hypothetical protein
MNKPKKENNSQVNVEKNIKMPPEWLARIEELASSQ